MKKAIAIIVTLAIMVFGSTFVTVAAGDGADGLPDVLAPLRIEQG